GDASQAWDSLVKDHIGLNDPVSWEYATIQISDCLKTLKRFFPTEASEGFGPATAPFWFAIKDLQAPLYYSGDQQLRGVVPPWQNWANPTNAPTLPEGVLQTQYDFPPLTFGTDLTP